MTAISSVVPLDFQSNHATKRSLNDSVARDGDINLGELPHKQPTLQSQALGLYPIDSASTAVGG